MFNFEWFWCILLLPLPIVIWFLLPETKRVISDDKSSIPKLLFPNLLRLNNIEESTTNYDATNTSNKLFVILLSLLWVSLIIALMQPQIVNQKNSMNYEGYDIMLALDLSPSMSGLDFATKDNVVSRLDVTKNVVSDFLKKRKGDRVGLILFGEHAYLHVPLTLDLNSLTKMLKVVQINMAGGATSIGDAIGIAVKTLRHRPSDTKILILLTDGDDNSSAISPIEAAKLAKEYNIRIYTIGIGKDEPVPYPSGMGGIIMQHVPMNRDILIKIADITGGKFFEATDKDTLSNIYNEINMLEKVDIEQNEYFITTPLFRYPLFVSLILLLLIGLLPLSSRYTKY